jgi:FixJ family two-component response regulator
MRVSSFSWIAIVSVDAHFRQSTKELVKSAGLQVNTFPTLPALLDAEELQGCDCLVFHSEKNALNDPAQQAWLRAACAGRSGILITEPGNVRTAVQALKAGIREVVQKPYRDKELLQRILNALEANAFV